MAGNTTRQSKSHPTWTDVKAKLADFDRAALLDLIRSLYSANKDNQVFLHSRFGLGGDVLEPYKKIIDRWLWPDVLRKQDVSVSQAKQAISDYKKAVGDPEGVAELMVFYCEQAAGFCSDIYSDDEGYFNALVRMFEQALQSGRHSASVSLGSVLGAPDPIRQPAAVPPPLLRCPVAGVS